MSNSNLKPFALERALKAVREKNPLVHSITNYVTVNDCANAVLACGGSPIMSDEAEEVEEITSICDALVLNIGTLNKCSIEAMMRAGRKASQLKHPIVLDPVGAGASKLRTQTAVELLRECNITAVRGNMSEMRALDAALGDKSGVAGVALAEGAQSIVDDAPDSANVALAEGAQEEVSALAHDTSTHNAPAHDVSTHNASARDVSTCDASAHDTSAHGASADNAKMPDNPAPRGVDAAPEDAVTSENVEKRAQIARKFARKIGSIVVITGEVDIVSSSRCAYAISNGSAMAARITGAGCMLSCVLGAYLGACSDDVPSENMLSAALSAVAGHGICGEIAEARMVGGRGRVVSDNAGVAGVRRVAADGMGNTGTSGKVATDGTWNTEACGKVVADGTGSFRTYFIDALSSLDAFTLESRAIISTIGSSH